MMFSLYRIDLDALLEGVEFFKYLWQNLDQTDHDWMYIWWNVAQAQMDW